jgi:hypothetical protein
MRHPVMLYLIAVAVFLALCLFFVLDLHTATPHAGDRSQPPSVLAVVR